MDSDIVASSIDLGMDRTIQFIDTIPNNKVRIELDEYAIPFNKKESNMNENCACSGCVPPLPGDGNPNNPWCTLNEAKDMLGSSGKYLLEKNPVRTAEQDGLFHYRQTDKEDCK